VGQDKKIKMTIEELNNLDDALRTKALLRCCGSVSWAQKMKDVFPVMDLDALINAADEKWVECAETDWLEAFSHHPKIGEQSLKEKFTATAAWASGEQAGVQVAADTIIKDLADANSAYEQKFGFIFIVCATGKSAEEMLQMLNSRMMHERDYELRIAAAEQAKITRLRLQKLIA
jgi:2-oxo-4-hydroxy-4-carboxy-5-ureidoimidazoline decarboxylase